MLGLYTQICRFSSYIKIWHSLFFLSTSDPVHDGTAEGIENMADAVTHARFVGTDPASDEVVLMKILQVTRERKDRIPLSLSRGQLDELLKLFVSCYTETRTMF